MKKYTLKNLVALLITLVFAVMLVSAPVAAYEATPEDIVIIGINNSGMEVEGLKITENAFRFFGLPDKEYDDVLILQVRDSSGTVVHQYQADRTADTCDFPMLDFPAGSYDLCLWSGGASADGEWHWEHLTSLAIRRTANGWELHDDRAYAQNQSLAGQRADKKARAWYLDQSTKSVQADDPRIIVLALTITEDCETAYTKALAIHDWICENIYYDYDYLNGLRPDIDVSAIGVLDAGMTVCAGYSNLFCALCRAAGVAAKFVTGYAKSASLSSAYPNGVFTDERMGNHAWNEFLSDDGRWVVVDCTWDCGNSCENGVKTKSMSCEHKYFDPAPDWFSQTHALNSVSDVRQFSFFVGYSQFYDAQNSAWKDYSADGAAPYLDEGQVMIPLYAVVRMFSGDLKWDEETYPGWVALDCRISGHYLTVFLGWEKFFVDGEVYCFSKAPELVNGNVRVDVQPLLSALGCEVEWNDQADWDQGVITVTCEMQLRP